MFGRGSSWSRPQLSRSGPYSWSGSTWIRRSSPVDEANLRDAIRRFTAEGGAAAVAGEGPSTGVAPDVGRGGEGILRSPGAVDSGRFLEPGAVISDAAARARARAGQDARERCIAALADVGTTFLAFAPLVRRIIGEEGVLVSTSPSWWQWLL